MMPHLRHEQYYLTGKGCADQRVRTMLRDEHRLNVTKRSDSRREERDWRREVRARLHIVFVVL